MSIGFSPEWDTGDNAFNEEFPSDKIVRVLDRKIWSANGGISQGIRLRPNSPIVSEVITLTDGITLVMFEAYYDPGDFRDIDQLNPDTLVDATLTYRHEYTNAAKYIGKDQFGIEEGRIAWMKLYRHEFIIGTEGNAVHDVVSYYSINAIGEREHLVNLSPVDALSTEEEKEALNKLIEYISNCLPADAENTTD